MISSTKAEEVDLHLRQPETVMRLDRMGASFQTRLSFIRQLIRRMREEKWRFETLKFDINQHGYGTSVFTAHTPKRSYSLVAFTQHIDEEQRTDRVIANVWDATFSLFDGIPTEEDIERLRANTPKQEGGRFLSSELCLARANKSTRLFEHVVEALANGHQPDTDKIAAVGYLMRTTAVYGSGKFGCADFQTINDREELQAPFQAEMICVYLIRWATIQWVNHIARRKNEKSAVELDDGIARYLGIGNSTGLGMAPFVIKYPVLIHNWVNARETAIAKVSAIEVETSQKIAAFKDTISAAMDFVEEWIVADQIQMERILNLRAEIRQLINWCETELLKSNPWARMLEYSRDNFSLEGQEFTISLVLEKQGEIIDELCHTMSAHHVPELSASMKVEMLIELIKNYFHWALQIDFSKPEAQQYFWYYSQEKLEPRIGNRFEEPGAELEMPVAIARDVNSLVAALERFDKSKTVAEFLMSNPELRHVVARVQTAPAHPYGEVCENLLSGEIRALDLLRFKLAFFGVSKFDPKSDLWTRVNIYHGAPLPHELQTCDADNWIFPTNALLDVKAH